MKILNSEFSRAYKYLLSLLSSVILNTKPPKPNEETDWALIFTCAKAHSVVGMLSYAVSKLEKEHRPSKAIMDELLQIQHSELILESNIQFETEKILEGFKKENLSAVVLKGMIMKNYYPVSSMRTMTDVDILYDSEQESRVSEVFKGLGYRLEINLGGELHFRKEPFHYYEMHPTLLQEERFAYSFFTKVWDNLRDYKDFNCKALSLEYTYLYMIEHLVGHILSAGAGLRHVMDVFVFLKSERNNLDWSFINNSLEELKLKDFNEKITALADSWFNSDNPETESRVAEFILSSSTFGIVDNAIIQSKIRTERKSGRKQNGFTHILRTVFPRYQRISARFPSVRKHKFLYPFFIPAYWCLRLFKDRNVNTSNLGKYFINTDSKQAQHLIKVMDDFSLNLRTR